MTVVKLMLEFSARGQAQAVAGAKAVSAATKAVGDEAARTGQKQKTAAGGLIGLAQRVTGTGGAAGRAAGPAAPAGGPAAGGGAGGLGRLANIAISIEGIKRLLSLSESGQQAMANFFDAISPLTEAIGDVAKSLVDAFGPALKSVAQI